jgi:hypothetical protein
MGDNRTGLIEDKDGKKTFQYHFLASGNHLCKTLEKLFLK